MKAKITSKSELTMNLRQSFVFDIVDDEGITLLTSQTVECSPSNAITEIKQKVLAYQEEYEKSQELPEGMEIE